MVGLERKNKVINKKKKLRVERERNKHEINKKRY